MKELKTRLDELARVWVDQHIPTESDKLASHYAEKLAILLATVAGDAMHADKMIAYDVGVIVGKQAKELADANTLLEYYRVMVQAKI